MNKHLLTFTRVVVLVRKNEADIVWLHTEYPSASPGLSSAPLVLQFTAGRGTGVEYVRQNFGLESEVIQG